jgi:hypothetical protein
VRTYEDTYAKILGGRDVGALALRSAH